MSWIGREALFIELTSVVAKDEQAQGTFKRIRAARKAPRRSCQACQVMAQFSIVGFHRIGIGLTFRNFVSAQVIPQAIISIECVGVIFFCLGRSVYQFLNGWLSALPDHFVAQITTRLPIYDSQDVDPVFLLPIKVNNSSISAALTSLGTGISGKLEALALTHNETVRW